MRALATYAIVVYYETPRRVRRLIPWVIALVAFISCVASASCRTAQTKPVQIIQRPTTPFDTARDGIMVPFQPLWWYRRWWAQMEECSGYQGDFDRVRWYIANKMFLKVPGSEALYFALTYQQGNEGPVYILFAITEANDSAVVHHEMLHALRALNGQREAGGSVHGQEDFVAKCGALVGPLPPGSH